jgi:GAF domain-containing protein
MAVPVVQIVRYEPDGAATLLAAFGECSDSALRSTVASPIVVSGQVWGATVVSSQEAEPLPSDTDSRLTGFNELISAAIAGAHAREELERPAAEQAALRRVATLVARGARPEDVFKTVAEEVAGLLPVTSAAMGRVDPDGMVTTVAAWSAGGIAFPVTRRWDPEGNNVTGMVLATGRSARIDDFSDASGPIGIHARDAGYRSAVGSPITVEGRLWGVMSAASSLAEPLSADAEARLASFTELVATAIANTESRSGLARLAEEQAALRRVATLVARAAPPAEVFVKVCQEVGPLLGAEAALINRFDVDGYCTTVGSWGKLREAFEVGSRWRVEGSGGPSAQVYRTGRPVRLPYDGPGSIAAEARRVGLHSAIGSPIIVNGRVWASLVVAMSEAKPLPDDAEGRIAQFAALVATSIANVQARSDLAASRARIISAADEERHRVVRALREGAEKHLGQTIVTVEQARDRLEHSRPDAPDFVIEALRHAQAATDELRELAHGILPSALSDAGLEAGVKTLASRMAIPVEVDVSVERLPQEVEATAYLVVSEALTNIAKRANAQGTKVTASTEDRALWVDVCDDGIADPPAERAESIALKDRLDVLGGSVHVESLPHGGTRFAACIPVPQTNFA